jgi:hypothetical protein
MAGAIAGTSILNVPMKNENKEQQTEEIEACNFNCE